jgi:hypothetical protein
LFSINRSATKFPKKYQYRIKTGYPKGRNRFAQPIALYNQSFIKSLHMSNRENSSGLNTKKEDQSGGINLPIATAFNYENHIKACKHRTATGFCTNSQRQCPATLFTIPFNN